MRKVRIAAAEANSSSNIEKAVPALHLPYADHVIKRHVLDL